MSRFRLPPQFLNLRLLIPVIIGLAAVIVWFASGGYDRVAWLFTADTESAEHVARIRGLLAECGPWAPAVYVAFVTTEVVVAPVPGVLLYAPGGLIFGPFLGGLLALTGNVLGAGIACLISRRFGRDRIERFFPSDRVESIQSQLEQRGSWFIFLLRANPLTSTDLLSYAAGFTRIPVWQVMLATGCGMAPLCFLQSWISDSLFTTFPKLIWPLAAVCCVYLLAVVIIIRRILKNQSAAVPAPAENSDNDSFYI